MRITKNFGLFAGFALVISCSLFMVSCGGGGELESDVEKVGFDSTATNVLELGNTVFCIPSPVQTAILVKEVGATYDKELMNSPSNESSYSTNFQKALNLGVYGADLGYATIYEHPQDGLSYLKTVQGLADDIGVASAFSPEMIARITNNIGNQDSLLKMVGNCYRSLNSFLQENDRDDVCALVLAGGWIESTYFVTAISGTFESQELVNRLAEQKTTLENLIKIIEPYYNDPQFTELLDEMYGLSEDFDNVTLEYVYEKPTVDEENKKTVINSKSNVSITPELISSIRAKIAALREQVIG
ncbi:MAG: hypothetical protein JKY52_07195 [Flavobacteriales bacterium]|nr:hypothetical protein [Flavobacteriales bacterium]